MCTTIDLLLPAQLSKLKTFTIEFFGFGAINRMSGTIDKKYIYNHKFEHNNVLR